MYNKVPENNQSLRTKTQTKLPVEGCEQGKGQTQTSLTMTIIVWELSPTITVKDTSLKGKNICEVL